MKIPRRDLSQWLRRLPLLAVFAVAIGIAAFGLVFGIWATATKASVPFARQVGLTTVYAFSLGALVAAAGMIRWSTIKLRRPPVSGSQSQSWRIMPVSTTSPGDVRVHAAAGPRSTEPPYVLRDHDQYLIERLQLVRNEGGFLLLIGGSSTGKSRSLLNAVQRELSDWQLFLPSESKSMFEAASTGALKPRTIVWLDDTPVERYLTASEDGLSGDFLRKLLDDHHPIVIVDSIWPSRYQALASQPDGVDFGDSPLDASREVRDAFALAGEPVRVGEQFSLAERTRAESLAKYDDRLTTALADTQFGVTQSLAGAPSLVRRYLDAESANPYAYAVLNAAIDSRRLGLFGPLTEDYLQLGSLGYLSDRLRAAIPTGTVDPRARWFLQALEYATNSRALPGHVAPLVALPGSMTGTVGYTVADYLLQYGQLSRRDSLIPSSIWKALLKHSPGAADLRRVAETAENRLLFSYARRYLQLADDKDAKVGINRSSYSFWLAKHDRIEELRGLANAGNRGAQRRLANWLATHNQIDELRQRSDSGDNNADRPLAIWLADRNQFEELQLRAESGNRYAKERLDVLTAGGAVSDAASRSNADRLFDLGEIDELRTLARQGDGNASARLAGWLADNDKIEELRQLAESGDVRVQQRLTGWLIEHGKIDELFRRSDLSGRGISKQVAAWLANTGQIGELRRRADSGDRNARSRLAGWLAKNGHIRELRDRATKGDFSAKGRLMHWLAENNEIAELEKYANEGYGVALERLADWLARSGDVDALRQRAASDYRANKRLVELLAEDGQIEDLQTMAVGGNGEAARYLLHLAARGRIRNASRLVRYGLTPDGRVAEE